MVPYVFGNASPYLARDPSGLTSLIEINQTIAIIGALTGGLASGLSNLSLLREDRVVEWVGIVTIGAVFGATSTFSFAGEVLASALVFGGGSAFFSNLITTALSGRPICWANLAFSFALGGGLHGLGSVIAGALSRDAAVLVDHGGGAGLEATETIIEWLPSTVTWNQRLGGVVTATGSGGGGLVESMTGDYIGRQACRSLQ